MCHVGLCTAHEPERAHTVGRSPKHLDILLGGAAFSSKPGLVEADVLPHDANLLKSALACWVLLGLQLFKATLMGKYEQFFRDQDTLEKCPCEVHWFRDPSRQAKRAKPSQVRPAPTTLGILFIRPVGPINGARSPHSIQKPEQLA